MPPAPGSVTAARTSSTDSGVSRNSASLTTFTEQRYPDRAAAEDRHGTGTPPPHTRPSARPVEVLAAPATPGSAHDRGGADHRDGGPGGGNGRLLARDAARGRAVHRPSLPQSPQASRVVVGRAPARLAQRPAVHDPRVDQILQVIDGAKAIPIR